MMNKATIMSAERLTWNDILFFFMPLSIAQMTKGCACVSADALLLKSASGEEFESGLTKLFLAILGYNKGWFYLVLGEKHDTR